MTLHSWVQSTAYKKQSLFKSDGNKKFKPFKSWILEFLPVKLVSKSLYSLSI